MLRLFTSPDSYGNLHRKHVAEFSAAGFMVKLRKGAFIENPFYSGEIRPRPLTEDPSEGAELINDALAANSLMIARVASPGGMLCGPTAARYHAAQFRNATFDPEGVINMAAGYDNDVFVGANLSTQIPQLNEEDIIPLLLRQHRSHITLPEGLKDRTASLASLKHPHSWYYEFASNNQVDRDGRNHKYPITSPAFTLFQLLTDPELRSGSEELALDLFPSLGLSPGSAGFEKSVNALRNQIGRNLRGNWTTKLDNFEDQVLQLGKGAGLKNRRVQALVDVSNAISNVFDVSWYDKSIARLEASVSNHYRLVYHDSWLLPLYTNDADDSALNIMSLLPEQVEITPSGMEAFLLQYHSFMSNLRICPHGKRVVRPIDQLQQSLDSCIQHGQYSGDLRSLPIKSSTFMDDAGALTRETAMTQISGAQVKVPMNLRDNQLAPAIYEPFTHILKLPAPGDKDVLGTVEWFGMQLAKGAGLEVPSHCLVDLHDTISDGSISQTEMDAERSGKREYVSEPALRDSLITARVSEQNPFLGAHSPVSYDAPGFLIERFDIPSAVSGEKLLMEDFAQILNRKDKYQGTAEQVAASLKSLSTNWQADSQLLYRQVIASVLISNADMHLKNLGILKIANSDLTDFASIRLAPAYDMLFVRAIPNHDSLIDQSLSVNNTKNPTTKDLISFAIDFCDVDEERAYTVLSEVAEGMTRAALEILDDIPPLIARSGRQRTALYAAFSTFTNRLSYNAIDFNDDDLLLRLEQTILSLSERFTSAGASIVADTSTFRDADVNAEAIDEMLAASMDDPAEQLPGTDMVELSSMESTENEAPRNTFSVKSPPLF